MQNIIYLEPKRTKLNLESVKPLLQYLHGLPQACSDRELTWAEDETACSLLLCLPLPPDSPMLENLVLYYAERQYRVSRTLCVWYGIARAVARLIQDRA
ncbi:MAG TPA: hypothetical protein VJZ94_01945 [Candidatus Paceibacterota bacterium]|nr:hypothetical protein [Candidatus Paceibacterota bacterium]